MDKVYKDCQSCSLPLNKDPHGGGTNEDGSRSKMYCSNCYENGQYKQPAWSADQMRDFVKGKMKDMGFPGFLAGPFSRRIYSLERWKDKV
jgi:hypothetical protein